ncbi:MAG: SH3 domain-containing protein, partial [Pseudomonadota bacterium]
DRPWWANLVATLNLRGWTFLFLPLWWITLGILFLVRYTKPGPARSGLIAANVFLWFLTVSCGLLLAGRIYLSQRITEGIVLPNRVAVHEGPASDTRNTFNLHAGFRVRIASEQQGWVRIRLSNGLEGWLPRKKIGVL